MVRTFLLIVVILAVNLVTTLIGDFAEGYKDAASWWIVTLVGMAIVALIFYPLFLKMESWASAISKRIVGTAGKMGGKLAVYIVLAVLLVTMFGLYAWLWFDVNVIDRVIG